MSSNAAHHDEHPAPAPKKKCHGPGDCYGMPEKRFWRIIFFVATLTMTVVATTVILVEA